MAEGSQFLVTAGSDAAYQMDALDDFNGSAESGVQVRIRSKAFTPRGPVGQTVCRRLFVQGYHQNGTGFTITPIADGVPQTQVRRTFNLFPATQGKERFSFLTPLGKFHAGNHYTTGVRATTYGYEITSFMPKSTWSLESAVFDLHLLHDVRGRTQQDS